jgi:tRNA-modifying protein YgfZ
MLGLALHSGQAQIAPMTAEPLVAHLKTRAVISVTGPEAHGFLQGLLTQDVETLAPGELRFGALLTPQGRLLFDLFLLGREDGVWLDVAADQRQALLQRLTMYRLRAKVELAALDVGVFASFAAPPDVIPEAAKRLSGTQERHPEPLGPGSPARMGGLAAGMTEWCVDPRLPALGWRGYGAFEANAAEADYDAHRLGLGVPGAADWGTDKTYPIEANFDLLNGIDFAKGCFVGQETTSRMKRRGIIKNRMLPIRFEGPALTPGTEVLAGTLRAGEVLSGVEGHATALVRLDRAVGAELTVDGRSARVETPDWMPAT